MRNRARSNRKTRLGAGAKCAAREPKAHQGTKTMTCFTRFIYYIVYSGCFRVPDIGANKQKCVDINPSSKK